jgi:hypothetical protein
MAEFWPHYKELVAQVYQPLSSGDGFSDDEVASAEQRLGFRLPRLLREFYLLAGRRRDINHAHNQLVHPNDLRVDDENLVFYVENQAACVWGVAAEDLDAADPPVVRGDSLAGVALWEWEPESEPLSSFLLAMLCWQAVMGGMAYSASVNGIDAQVERTIGAHWRVLDIGARWSGLRPYIGDGQVLCLMGAQPRADLYAGARSEKGLAEIEELLNVEWDYSSSNDGRGRA